MEQNFVYSLLGENYLSILIVAIIPLLFVLPYALVTILGELKISAWMQDKLGPMRTGWKGVLQPLAEVFKLLQKEDITPKAANKPLFNMAPFVMFAAAYAAYAVIPFSSTFIPAGINIGLVYIFAISALGVVAIVMGGWASANKYSLLGAMRAAAQMVSYEIPLAMVILSMATLAGSLDMQEIVIGQGGGFWNWNLFGGAGDISKIWVLPFTFALFLIYFIGSLAETNRAPFDIVEGESELVAGYATEYGGMKYAMLYFAEYSNMFIVAAIIVVLFLGGWQSPFGDFLNSPIMQAAWFICKAMSVVFVQIWVRWTLPRLRVDQLMYITWKVMLPISFVCFFAVAVLALLK